MVSFSCSDRKKHQRKLEEISSRRTGSIGVSPLASRVLLGTGSAVMSSAKIQEEIRRLEDKMKRNKEFQMNEKNLEINRSN